MQNIVQRFNSKWTHVTDCWLWQAAKNSDGYGSFRRDNATTCSAHRMSWEIHRGPVPEGMQVLHHCDTPACVNPSHLYLGTQLDNIQDRVTRGRGNRPIGEKHPQAKLTEDDVRRIRADDRTYKQIAADYGVSYHAIDGIKRGKRWKHVN